MKVLKALLSGACLTSSAFAFSSLSGTVRDTANGSIDGAKITVWDAGTGKGVQTASSMGSFSLSGLAEGDYLIKVEADSTMPVLGAFHLAVDEMHAISIVVLNAAPKDKELAGAGSPLRGSVRPPRASAIPPRVRPAQVRKKVMPSYPAAERKAGVAGIVRIAMVILPDGAVNDLAVLSAPNSNLGIAALLAVRQWLYSPTYLDNQPVEASLTVDVTFGDR